MGSRAVILNFLYVMLHVTLIKELVSFYHRNTKELLSSYPITLASAKAGNKNAAPSNRSGSGPQSIFKWLRNGGVFTTASTSCLAFLLEMPGCELETICMQSIFPYPIAYPSYDPCKQDCTTATWIQGQQQHTMRWGSYRAKGSGRDHCRTAPKPHAPRKGLPDGVQWWHSWWGTMMVFLSVYATQHYGRVNIHLV